MSVLFTHFWRRSGQTPFFLLVVILTLSAYTHTWNPAGFPVLVSDESVYVKRGVGVLNNEILYGKYDHPFFGQIVIAGFMHVAGYQNLIDDPSTDPSHIEAFYAYPRAFMGLLAVIDTLLVYLIANRMFGWRVATVSAVIFAAAPMSLLLKMVMLDSILLPFVLSSVLLALYSRSSVARRHALLIASGVCLGLAIFTKIPAVVMIPPCALLAYSASRKIRDVGIWFTPIVAIPAIWPAYAAQAGQFDMWIDGIVWQAGRTNSGLPQTIRNLFEIDPILISLGMTGFAFVVICMVLCLDRERRIGGDGGNTSHTPAFHRPGVVSSPGPLHRHIPPLLPTPPSQQIKTVLHNSICKILDGIVRASHGTRSNIEVSNYLVFLTVWFSSILLFFGAIGFVSIWHLSTLLPILCIASALLIIEGGWRVTRHIRGWTKDRMILAATLTIGLAGTSTTGVIVYFDTQSEFDAISFLLQNLDDPNTTKIIPFTSYWILSDVYGMQNTTLHSNHDGQTNTYGALLLISDQNISYFLKLKDRCDDPDYNNQEYCSISHNVLDTLNESITIKEFRRAGIIDALPPLPYNIERHLMNPWRIMEWHPAG